MFLLTTTTCLVIRQNRCWCISIFMVRCNHITKKITFHNADLSAFFVCLKNTNRICRVCGMFFKRESIDGPHYVNKSMKKINVLQNMFISCSCYIPAKYNVTKKVLFASIWLNYERTKCVKRFYYADHLNLLWITFPWWKVCAY